MTTVTITLPVHRTDTETFFRESGYYSNGMRWTHYPLIAFVASADAVEVQILDTPSKVRLSTLPDTTQCMQQWGGHWRSDFFTFTLGDARAALS